MISYTTVGTNDLDRARTFYDALFSAIGVKRLADWGDAGSGWGKSFAEPVFGVMKPFNKAPATVGNGVMISIGCKSEAEVNALHAKAIALGGADEGAPGLRGEGFYAAYFRDLDGNKLNGFYMSSGG
jgi:catechol 2,3-dioxygenase-like lactoylglutathione lyase family enzyme